jgi:tetratricopeptide (TPR) repeat protein
LGRADVARAIVEHALQLNPTYSIELWCLLGDVLHAQGDRTAALRAVQQAVALDGRHPRALWSLGWLQAERGRFGEAFELLGRALRWDRDGAWRSQILQLLDACLRGQALQADAEARRLAERDAG